MNINSLLAGFSAPAAGRLTGRVKVNTPPGSPSAGQDSFVRSNTSSPTSFPPLYTRAAAAGGLPRPANRGSEPRQSAGAAESPTTTKKADNAAVPEQEGSGKGLNDASKNPTGPRKPNGTPLSSSEKLLIDKLQKVDQEVHNHELSHLAAAGGYARSGASYHYQTGPDGRKYAVGGEVQIDTSPGKTPQETISKMETVRRAALAPASPSGQDQLVAAQATVRIAKAAQEVVRIATERNTKEAEAAAAAVKGAQPGRDDGRTPILQTAGAAVFVTPDSSAVQPSTSHRTKQAIRQYLRSASGSFGRVV